MDKNMYLKIQRPGDKCLGCGADLIAAHKHPSAVRMDGAAESLERSDYCAECWGKLEEGQYFSHWLAKREAPPERNRISREERNRLLLALFELLSVGGEAEGQTGEDGALAVDSEAIRYFLGHLLMRFRIFKWHRTEADSGLIFFENTQSGESYSVQSMELDDETILKIKNVVEECLRKGQNLDVSL